MPISFPPPPVPMQGDAATLQADSNQGAVSVAIAGYTMYVQAHNLLSAEQIAAATAGIEDLSMAVRSLATAAQGAGVLIPKVLYGKVGNDVFVSIYAGTLNTVSAPDQLTPYFAGFSKGQPSTIADFEKRRLLAGIHASRMGAAYTSLFTTGEGDTYDLALKPTGEAVSPGALSLSFSNVGNRFTGREFLDLNARRGDSYGNEYSVLARTAAKVLEIDKEEPGSDYHEYHVGASRVTPLGLFGMSARYLDYRQLATGSSFNGELWTVDLGYTGIVRSSLTSRVTVQSKLDYIYKTLKPDVSNARQVQKEPYPSVELGVAWSKSFQALSQSWLSLAAVSARQGLGADSIALTIPGSDLDYWLVRPTFSLRSQSAPFSAELQLGLQYAGVTVPEQQQYIVGGIGNLHAYVPGVAAGDRGLLARLLAEYAGTMLHGVNIRPRIFAEFAAAEFANDNGLRPDGVQSLTDVGGEMVLGFTPSLEITLTSAYPVQHENVAKQVRDDARTDFFFRLTAKF